MNSADAARREQASAPDDDEMIRGQRHLGHEMARDQDRPPFRGEGAQQMADPEDAFRVEAVDGFVEDEDRGIAEQCGGDAEPLSHAERERSHPSMRDVGQTDDRQYFVDAASRNRVGVGEPEQMVAGPTAGVRGVCVEERADFVQGKRSFRSCDRRR
jgi:hypothetical protein